MAERSEKPRTSDESSERRSGGGLTDALRKYVDALAGVTEVPRDRAEKIVSELAKRGEVRARDLQKAARELSDRSTRNRNELLRLIQKEIRRQIQAMGVATRDDVERLQRRLRAVEQSAKRAPRKAAPKKSSPSKSTER